MDLLQETTTLTNGISSLKIKITGMKRSHLILVHRLLLQQHHRHELLQSK